MISQEEFIMIHTLRKQGYSLREIVKISGIDRKTVRKRLKQPELSSIIRNNKKLGKLDEYKPYILKWIGKSDARIPSTAILPEIQRYGYTGSLRILQEFLTNEYRKRTNLHIS